MLSFAAICPHPPILIPSIGGEEVSKVKNTAEAMKALGRDIKAQGIDTIMIISPHGSVFMDAMSINSAKTISGDLSDFQSDIKMKFENDLELVSDIISVADANDFPLETVNESLDHGSLVPLYFLTEEVPEAKLCHMSFSYLDYDEHFTFGELLFEAVRRTDKKIAIIASGDLSHRLTTDAPAGFSPDGKVFDRMLIKELENGDVKSILNTDQELIDNAGECGFRSIVILLGALSNTDYRFKKQSYEGPFGVGYLVGKFEITDN